MKDAQLFSLISNYEEIYLNRLIIQTLAELHLRIVVHKTLTFF